MRQAPEDVNDAIDGTDGGAHEEHCQDDERRRIDHPEHQPADDGGESEIGANREIDASRQDHELLTHRHNGNDRCLSNDITKIAKLQKVRSEQADRRDEQNRISRGPKLRSRSPIETASNPSAGRSLIHELDPVPACSFVTSATAESPRRHVPYRKKPASDARQLVFYVLKVSFPRAIVMKTDRVFKRAFNEALDLVASLEVGEPLHPRAP